MATNTATPLLRM